MSDMSRSTIVIEAPMSQVSEVLFDLEEKVGVGKADGVAGRGPVQVRVLPAG